MPQGEMPPIIAVVGRKNSGKTTLLVRVVAELTRRGSRVATLKHGHHAMQIDEPGRDSWRHMHEGGAEAVILVSGSRVALVERNSEEPDPEALIRRFYTGRGYDLVLVEGYKHGPFPKVEVHRAELHDAPIHDPQRAAEAGLLALVSDRPAHEGACPIIPLGADAPDAPHVVAVADLLASLLSAHDES